ncbi:Ribonuclease HI [Diplonema papillatum]|nr:Ribonuclease HI [Diplonema papillatum]
MYLAAYGRKCFWGEDVPIVIGTNGVGQRAPGGAAVVTRDSVVASKARPRTELETRLVESTRVAHAVIATGSARSVLHVISVYAQVGKESGVARERERFLAEVFEMAAGLGQVPVAIVGDLNTTIEESVSLRDACRNGWTDAAAAAANKTAQEPPPTCWAGAAGSRIDLCFLNECASQALVHTWTADPHQYDIPTHCPLFVTLDMRTAATPKRTHWIPAPFPRKAPLKTPEEEKGALEAALRQKRAVGGAEAVLRNASEVAETYLLEIHKHDLQQNEVKKCKGRAEGHSVRDTHVSARQAVSARGAGNRSTRQRDRVLGMLRTVIAEAGRRLDGEQPREMTLAERNARNALQRKTPRECLTQHFSTDSDEGGIGELERLTEAVEAIEGSQREAVAALKQQRTRRWKDRVQRAWNSTDRGDVYRFLAGSQESPSIFLRRQDGTLTACPKEIDELLRGPEAWGGIFQRYASTEEPQWEAFKANYARNLPAPQQMECKKIGAADVRTALKKMKKTTSPGLHAWRVFELQQLPTEILQLMAEAMNAVEAEGRWPEQLMHAILHLLPKPGSTGDPMSQRPISITPVLYRLWAAIRAKEALEWMDKVVPSGLHGCRKKHGTDDLVWHLAALIEEAHVTGEPLYGLALDFKKCFDSVPIDIAFRLAEELGFHPTVLQTLRAAYSGMQRHFRIGTELGEGFVPTNGIMQGCPLSVVLINVLISVWMRHVADIEAAIPLSYVDDVYALLKSLAQLQEAANRSGTFAGLTGMKVCTQVKSLWFTTARDAPEEIHYTESNGAGEAVARPETIARQTTFDVLGVMLTTKQVPPSKPLQQSKRVAERVRMVDNVLKRATCLPLPAGARDLAVSMTAGSKLYYGAAVTAIGKQEVERMRRRFTESVWTGPPRRAQEAVLHVLHHGHRLDPGVVPMYRQITTWAEQVKKWGYARALAETAWVHREELAKLHGPFAFLKEALDKLQWRWVTPTCIAYVNEVGEGIVHDAAQEGNTRLLQHDLRHSLRMREMVRLAARRGNDFGGVQSGVDFTATRSLLEKQNSPLTAYQAGLLRSVIAGATPVTGRTGLSERGCPYCNTQERETVEHLFWKCPAWEQTRVKYAELTAAQQSWPPCLRMCGVAPAPQADSEHLPREREKLLRLLETLHLFFVEVLTARQGADEMLDRSTRHHRTLEYPRQWRPAEPHKLVVPDIAPSAVSTKWKYGPEMWMAFTDWLRELNWAPPGHELGVSFVELAVDFELCTGCRLPALRNRYYSAPKPPAQKATTARRVLPEGAAGGGIAVYFDGGARANGTAFAVAGAGAVLYKEGVKVSQIVLPLPNVRSNNIAEYEGMLAGLQLLEEAEGTEGKQCTIRGDSALVIGQTNRKMACSEDLKPLLTRAIEKMVALRQRLTLRAEHVKREENVDADALSNAAMDLVQQQRPTREQQEADLAAFRASGLGKAMSLVELGSAYKKVTGRPWFYGHECATTILTSVGGTVVRGASRRAQLTETTDAVILGIREHVRTQKPTRTETALYPQHLEWAATYIPEEAYPAGWAQGKADWKARAEMINKVSGAGACGGSQPKKAPEDAVNTSRPGEICTLHRKPRCKECAKKRLPAETCCRYKQHHHEGDGLRPRMLYCSIHRLGRCGECEADNEGIARCCTRHHPQLNTDPHSQPAGASAVT